MSLTEREKSAYEWFKQRDEELQRIAADNDGRLERHDWWRSAYYRHPYMLLEPGDVIIDRFVDVFSNGLDITAEGKISITPMFEKEGRLAQFFTEIIEETNSRGILTRDAMVRATDQISSYFQSGTPLGVKMFRNSLETKGRQLVKFSKKQFVADMYKYGRFRISPASYYAKGSHVRAVRDLEIARGYRLKAIREAIGGERSIEFQGRKIPIVNGVIRLDFIMDDYYLFSTCKRISRRMPTDFEADAALVIKDRHAFIRRLRDALMRKLPGWEFSENEVYYFDPYNDIPKDINQEFWKHIAYAYQNEHRCVMRPPARRDVAMKPFFVELGPLGDIPDVITAT